jgi:hypothetical protein
VTDPLALVLALVGTASFAYVVLASWRNLRSRCARPTAYWILAGMSVGLVAMLTVTYLTHELVATLIAVAIAVAIGIGDSFIVRATGGPDPGLWIQYRVRSILELLAGSPPAPERVREARARTVDLDRLRDARTTPLIGAMQDLITIRFDTRPSSDVDAIKGAYDRLQQEITSLQLTVGRPPDRAPRAAPTTATSTDSPDSSRPRLN